MGKNGVVRDPETHKNVLNEIISFADLNGLQVIGMDYSPITGPKGNIEFLAEIIRKDDRHSGIGKDQVSELVREAHERMIQS